MNVLFFEVLWYRITRFFLWNKREEWCRKAVMYLPYIEFLSTDNPGQYWMKLSHRDRIILMEFLLGVALGRFTDAMVRSYVDMFTTKYEKLYQKC